MQPAARKFDDRDRLAALRLSRTDGVGPITYRDLVQRFGSPMEVIEALPDLSGKAGKIARALASERHAESELERATSLGATLICLGEATYPPLLAEIPDPPPILSVLGDPGLLNVDLFAIVGARNASASGLRFTEMIANELGEQGFGIVSGMARGIDGAAHRASLKTGSCAVLAGGVDVVYPPQHGELYEALRNQGCIVSEMPIGFEPAARHFPRRNRLISGLAQGVIVVEAAERSGSLITARTALEQNREVFAAPGSPLDPRSAGANRLIRDGAILARDAADIIDGLTGPFANGRRLAPDRAASPKTQKSPTLDAQAPKSEAHSGPVLEILSQTPIEIDELIRRTGRSTAEIMAELLELEMTGRLVRHPGQKVSLG